MCGEERFASADGGDDGGFVVGVHQGLDVEFKGLVRFEERRGRFLREKSQ